MSYKMLRTIGQPITQPILRSPTLRTLGQLSTDLWLMCHNLRSCKEISYIF